MNNKQSGFTLIELLVVITIIAILAGIVLAAVDSAENRAYDTKIQGQLSNMRAQAEIYQPDGTYLPQPFTTYFVGYEAVPSGNTNDPNPPPAVPAAIFPGVSSTPTNNLFTDMQSTDSIATLIAGLPAGTFVFTASNNVPPSQGGEWVVAAEDPFDGFAYCVDSTGAAEADIRTFLSKGNQNDPNHVHAVPFWCSYFDICPSKYSYSCGAPTPNPSQ